MQVSSCDKSASTKTQDISENETPLSIPSKSEESQEEAEKHYREALKLQVAGQTTEAIEEFKKSIEAGKNDKEMYRRVAELLIKLKRNEEAEMYLRRVIEKDSKDARAHWTLAAILVEMRNYENGLKEANLAKELYGESDISYVFDRLIGQAYDGLGDYENAIKHYKIFLKGRSYAPDSDDYKETQKRVSELEKQKQ